MSLNMTNPAPAGEVPAWLAEVAERSGNELAALPESAQPSWYRWVREPSAAAV